MVVERVRRGVIDGEARQWWEPIHWWPTPGAGVLDPEVPPTIAGAYDEAMRCLAIQAYRATVVMCRGMLAYVVEDQGSDEVRTKKSLAAQLRQMSVDGSLHTSLANWADHVRLLGNVGAHPNELGLVTAEEATELTKLCRQLLTVLYEVPASIDRARANTSADTTASPPATADQPVG
jgi:hypothetical protein